MLTDKKNTSYAVLKQRLSQVGIAIPGTVHALYARCGSPTCPCATDDEKRHGPYYRWHYRLHGRSVAIGIDEKNLQQFKQWIENREKIFQIVEEMLEIGVGIATESQLTATSASGNSKNIKSPMRGK
jgi:hypothetical protein